MARGHDNKEKVTASSGNVFEDLGIANAEERNTKLQLAVAINELLNKRGLTQASAAAQLGVNQPKVSALLNYKLEGISVERLMSFLTALHQDIEIVIRGRTGLRRGGKIVVRAA